MTPTELQSLRTRLGLTQAAAARLVGVALRTWVAWEGEDRAIPEPAARLLRAMERDPSLREWLDAA